jgi:16S rRNA (cytosine1402-N4)-methyltransferase
MDTSLKAHQPVLLLESLQALAMNGGELFVDCTFGRGGHSSRILNELKDEGRLLALDKDPEAIASSEASLLRQDVRFQLLHQSYSGLKEAVAGLGWAGRVSGVLMDLGVSSPQLDVPERGFSFNRDGPLDMRMNTHQGETAAEWLARVSEADLADVLFTYGEERFARRIAREIVNRRQNEPLLTTKELVKAIEVAVPTRERGKHPATRSFQAIRIWINRELSELEEGLIQALDVLRPGGRLVVIAFHSLEDRIVKRFMRDGERGFTVKQARQWVQPDLAPTLHRIGRAIKPGRDELNVNPRARSAVMRVAEKTQ